MQPITKVEFQDIENLLANLLKAASDDMEEQKILHIHRRMKTLFEKHAADDSSRNRLLSLVEN